MKQLTSEGRETAIFVAVPNLFSINSRWKEGKPWIQSYLETSNGW